MDLVQAADIAITSAGVLVVLGTVVRLAPGRRWRRLLRELPARPGGPGWAELLAGLALCVLLQQVGVLVAVGAAADWREPGSAAWHAAQAGLQAGNLLAAGALAVLLAWRPFVGESGPALRTGVTVAVLSVLALLPVLTVLHEAGRLVYEQLRPGQAAPLHTMLRALHTSAWGVAGQWQIAVGAIVVAPLLEELLFRGLLLGALRRHLRSAGTAIATAGVAFGLIHVAQPQDVAPLAVMGIVLGYVRVRWGALWPCVLIHMLFNGRTIALALLVPEAVGAR